jgi:hypothetical protein
MSIRSPETQPPSRPGDRVRCVVSTVEEREPADAHWGPEGNPLDRLA